MHWKAENRSPVFQRLPVTGYYTEPRLRHAPISLCLRNLCTLVEPERTKATKLKVQLSWLFGFERRVGNCVRR